MKVISSLFVLFASLAWSQATPPSTPSAPADKPDKVIAVFDDGSKLTESDLQALIPLLSETYRPVAQQNPEKFAHLYGVIKRAAAAAQSEKLGDQSPYKQGVDFAVMEALARFYVHQATAAITISPDEVEKYYNEHKEPFRRIKVSGIKIAFGNATPESASSSQNASRVTKKALTEDEAKAKAQSLVTQLRAGADFAKMVQTESDDEASKARGGDLGVWKMTDNVPDDLRAAVLGLKEGGVSDPIRQPGGFYIVHADAVTYAPLSEVQDAIFEQLKQEKATKWLQDFDKNTKVEIPKNDPQPAPAPSDPKK